MTLPASRSRRTPGLAAAAAVVAGLALTLSACSSTGQQAGAGNAPSPGASSSGAPSSGSASPGATQTSPLEAYLGAGGGFSSSESDDTRERRSEEAIARCMARQGFEYIPDPISFTVKPGPGGSQIISQNNPTFPDLPPDQFAARYGYGISTAPAPSQQKDPLDRNQAIVEKMSVSERVAYYQALYGTSIQLDSRGDLTNTITSSDDSCEGRAAAAFPDDPAQQTQAKKVDRVKTSYQSLLDRVSALNDQELADPRVRAATQTWSSCLAAAGFPGYDDLDAPRASILQKARALMGHDLDPTGVDPTRLAALRRREISLAVADNSCHTAWDQTFAAVRQDLETQFVKENLTELKSYRAALAAASR
jgi:hypothetical protein